MSGFEALPLQGHFDTKTWKPTTLKEQAEFDAEHVFNDDMRWDRDNAERREYHIRTHGSAALEKHVKHLDRLSSEQCNWLWRGYRRYFLDHWRMIATALEEAANWKEQA